jgi:hypothetical protein
MDDHNRDIVVRIRLNKAEHSALVALANANGQGVGATVRQFIHATATK